MEALTLRRTAPASINPAQQRERDAWRREIDLLTDLMELHGAGGGARTKAERLLRQAGNLSALLSGGLGRLRAIGATDCEIRTLQLIRNAVALSLRRRAFQRAALTSLRAVVDYLHADMAHLDHEVLRCLLLTNRNDLIHDELVHRGSLMSVEVHPRRVAQAALDHGAAAVILVHNHPSGNPTPSRDDVQISGSVRNALRTIGVLLHDHVIVARSGHVSMREMGLI